MIIPQPRLLWWAGISLLACGLAAAIWPRAAVQIYAIAAALMLPAALDALWAALPVAGVELLAPTLARLAKGVAGELELRVRSRTAARGLRVGLAAPPELGIEQPDITLRRLAAGQWYVAKFLCLPNRRGSYNVPEFYLGAASPLGFWLKRRVVRPPCEVRVYPDLLAERKKLGGLFLNRGGVGVHVQRQVGQGREFEKLRDYVPGDGYDSIHWKATAKRARPVTKVFQLERTQEVYVLVDSSRLTARPSAQKDGEANSLAPTALERFVTAALIMGQAAERQGDLFGVLSFSNRVDNFVRACNGKAHYRLCRDSLYGLQSSPVTPDFGELLTFLRVRLRRRALLVFLTSLDDPLLSETFVQNISLISRQHLVLVGMLKPAEVRPVFSAPAASMDGIYRDLGGHLQWRRLQELQGSLSVRGVQFHLMDDEGFCPQLVARYLAVKRRQLL